MAGHKLIITWKSPLLSDADLSLPEITERLLSPRSTSGPWTKSQQQHLLLTTLPDFIGSTDERKHNKAKTNQLQ